MGGGSRHTRNAIVEAATTTIRQDKRMCRIYARIKRRRGASKAKVAVEHHMLEMTWHILAKNKSYRSQPAMLLGAGS